jgi:hypothetical protein
VLLLEYLEERPLLMLQPGMGMRLTTYYRCVHTLYIISMTALFCSLKGTGMCYLRVGIELFSSV